MTQEPTISTPPPPRRASLPGRLRRWWKSLPAALAFSLISAVAAAAPAAIAIFDVELAAGSPTADPTGQSSLGALMLQHGKTSGADQGRLDRAGAELRRLVAALPGLALVDLAPVAAAAADAAPLSKCNGCVPDLARRAGAELALVMRVTRLTTVLIHFDVEVIDVASEKTIRAASVDINGDTDETWTRGVRWLVRNRLADPPLLPPRP